MSDFDRRIHWENVYTAKRENEVSWFEETPLISLDLIRSAGAGIDASIIDVGGGASRLVDALVDMGFEAITVLDVSKAALSAAKARLGARATKVRWIVADVTTWDPCGTYDVWHDRAAFHFLTQPDERAAYAERVSATVRPGGQVIIGSFALDGPERCSGLPVVRHDAVTLGEMLGRGFALMETRPYSHRTPAGAVQRFQFSRFRRTD